MNKITHKERTEKNNIVCPNCHINIKVLTDDLFLPMGDEWHDDMYISHEDEYLERKKLQQQNEKILQALVKIRDEIDWIISTTNDELALTRCKTISQYLNEVI